MRSVSGAIFIYKYVPVCNLSSVKVVDVYGVVVGARSENVGVGIRPPRDGSDYRTVTVFVGDASRERPSARVER